MSLNSDVEVKSGIDSKKEKKMKSEVVETKGARLWLDDDGIFRSVTNSNSEITLELAREHLEIHIKITGRQKTPVLTDIRAIKSITREARIYLSGEEAEEVHAALGILIGSQVSKVIGNFFFGLNKPKFPTKMFTSEEKALDWLKGFINNEES
jgi:hypothetical protein